MSHHVRWAFRVGAWTPSKEQWIFAARCIQTEEKQRIGRFVFQKDAKSALVSIIIIFCVYLMMASVIGNSACLPHHLSGDKGILLEAF